MSNVIQLSFPSRSEQRAAKYAALLDTFANHRRIQEDVFWMKENAELLNILECTGQDVAPEALAAHADFYNSIEERLEFFPQYYRFLLSICMDLEDLGIDTGKSGPKSAKLAEWVAAQGLVEAELSDLQRGEALRLLSRRDVTLAEDQNDINQRLHRFISRPATFSMPNKKAAYELSHIVFYLSEYGRNCVSLSAEAMQSLSFAGTLAFLDCNWDLVAEIIVSMRYAGMTPPAIWEEELSAHVNRFAIATGDDAVRQDEYHEYLVCNWALSEIGGKPFAMTLPEGPVSFHADRGFAHPLREMSETLYDLGKRRSGDWDQMRDYVYDNMGEDSATILDQAETACDDFAAFFAGFARTNMTPRIPAPQKRLVMA